MVKMSVTNVTENIINVQFNLHDQFASDYEIAYDKYYKIFGDAWIFIHLLYRIVWSFWWIGSQWKPFYYKETNKLTMKYKGKECDRTWTE